MSPAPKKLGLEAKTLRLKLLSEPLTVTQKTYDKFQSLRKRTKCPTCGKPDVESENELLNRLLGEGKQ